MIRAVPRNYCRKKAHLNNYFELPFSIFCNNVSESLKTCKNKNDILDTENGIFGYEITKQNLFKIFNNTSDLKFDDLSRELSLKYIV